MIFKKKTITYLGPKIIKSARFWKEIYDAKYSATELFLVKEEKDNFLLL